MPSLAFRLLALALTAYTLAPSSASALYCNRRIVTTGDVAHYVRSVCGEPASIVTVSEPSTQVVYDRRGNSTVIVSSVEYDVWVYDFGPSRFMIELVFHAGEVVRERTLGRGTSAGRVVSLEERPLMPRTSPRARVATSQGDARRVRRLPAHA